MPTLNFIWKYKNPGKLKQSQVIKKMTGGITALDIRLYFRVIVELYGIGIK